MPRFNPPSRDYIHLQNLDMMPGAIAYNSRKFYVISIYKPPKSLK